MDDGTLITGRTSDLMGCASAMLLNSLKYLAGIPDKELLLPRRFIEPVQGLKTEYLGGHNPRLHTDEVLVALAVSAAEDPNAALALKQLPRLKGLDAHSTVILSSVDTNTFRRLGLNVTSDPVYQTPALYHR